MKLRSRQWLTRPVLMMNSPRALFGDEAVASVFVVSALPSHMMYELCITQNKKGRKRTRCK